ncbi:uncharacterized protein LOC114527663 [Dendronephthya gigantea]|uniref:uncharacterized protein LOC114527663 n=1 Tax=Dendronephthya gigantea TaxID=151771 RepID=UPI00106C88AD|nr:uncharacterized protein LOC114527663 [Dendronephthya gigantea]
MEGTTPVMDDEKMLSSISSTCQALTQVPSTVIKSLGRLLLTSAKRDISLKEHCKGANLEYFKFPDSLCACLVQISNGVCEAFDAAHRSMERISVKSGHIATDAKSALQLMEKGEYQEWEMALHFLESAKESCLECVDKAAPVTEEFEKIGKTIDELNVVLTALKGKNEEEERSTRKKIEATRKEKERITKRKKNLDERCDKAKEECKDAAATCPSPWKTMLFKFLDGITPFAINLATELFKQKVMPLPQFSTPTLELGMGEGFFTETPKNMPEKRKREKKEEYDKCTIIRKKAKQGLQESTRKASKDLEKFNQEINDLNNVKHALEESIAQLLKIKEFWKQLKIMFQSFHDLIKDELEKEVNKTLEAGRKAMQTNKDSQKIPDMTRKMIIDNSKNAIKVAFVVKWISRFYVEVSNKYLLGRVNALQSITFLRSSSDYARMEEVLRKLEEDAEEAERGIPIIAEERKKDLRNELSQHQFKHSSDNM